MPNSPEATLSWMARIAGSYRRWNPIWTDDPGGIDRGDRRSGALQVEGDGLLTERGNAGGRGPLQHLGVGVGRGSDDHGVDTIEGAIEVDRVGLVESGREGHGSSGSRSAMARWSTAATSARTAAWVEPIRPAPIRVNRMSLLGYVSGLGTLQRIPHINRTPIDASGGRTPGRHVAYPGKAECLLNAAGRGTKLTV